jgi:tRNA pseudouridine55 synthase
MKTMTIDKTSAQHDLNRLEDHIILIDKPEGWTSFDVVKKVKHIGNFKKVGHAGTLDPFATGLLILGTGRQTRELTGISKAGKTYIARIILGRTTDTYDRTGTITGETHVNDFDQSKVERILPDFIGETEQYAPPFSAKKIAGVRLYKLARKGKTVTIKPHRIIIGQIRILSWNGCELELFIQCSTGTYVRSLAHDIGIKTGYGACVGELRRISVDGFSLEQALQITEFEKFWQGRDLN